MSGCGDWMVLSAGDGVAVLSASSMHGCAWWLDGGWLCGGVCCHDNTEW